MENPDSTNKNLFNSKIDTSEHIENEIVFFLNTITYLFWDEYFFYMLIQLCYLTLHETIIISF